MPKGVCADAEGGANPIMIATAASAQAPQRIRHSGRRVSPKSVTNTKRAPPQNSALAPTGHPDSTAEASEEAASPGHVVAQNDGFAKAKTVESKQESGVEYAQELVKYGESDDSRDDPAIRCSGALVQLRQPHRVAAPISESLHRASSELHPLLRRKLRPLPLGGTTLAGGSYSSCRKGQFPLPMTPLNLSHRR